MASKVLVRTTYTDPTKGGNPPRTADVHDGEALVDYVQYDKPLEQVHASSLHGWGIASGLTVAATLHAQGLQVSPGVAIDAAGQHISLAAGGDAEIGPNRDPNQPNPTGNSLLKAVGVGGVSVPTATLSGTMYLTITFLETFDLQTFQNNPTRTYQMDHTPWLQLVSAAPVGGASVVLAEVQLDVGANAGNVIGLVPGPRQGASMGVQRLSVRDYGAATAAPLVVGPDPAPEVGALLPRATGGLTIVAGVLGIQATPGAAEWISFDAASGQARVAGIDVSGVATAHGNLSVGGNLDVQGATSLTGRVQAAGQVVIGNPAGAPPSTKLRVGTPALGIMVATDEVALAAYNSKKTYGVILAATDVGAQINGPVVINGKLSKSAGGFKIDHPLDPANRYLEHSFVESPDMMNVYNGNVATDDQGEAVVVLPDYFEALNDDYRYQLTVIGQPAQAYVAEEISGGRFVIKTDRPCVKVSWQVTGVRRDAFARAHPIRVEEDKPSAERGLYLHPEAFGQPADRLVGRFLPPGTGNA